MMADDARMQKLEEALKTFEKEVARLKDVHEKAINAILQDIRSRQLASMKEDIQQHA